MAPSHRRQGTTGWDESPPSGLSPPVLGGVWPDDHYGSFVGHDFTEKYSLASTM